MGCGASVQQHVYPSTFVSDVEEEEEYQESTAMNQTWTYDNQRGITPKSLRRYNTN